MFAELHVWDLVLCTELVISVLLEQVGIISQFDMSDSTDSATGGAWMALLQQAGDALSKELLCVQRRYHGQVLASRDDGSVTVRCFLSLSDPDLPPEFKGESEIHVTFPGSYPEECAQLDLQAWQHRMSESQFAAVTKAVAARVDQLRGTYGIRKLLTWLDNNIVQLLQGPVPVQSTDVQAGDRATIVTEPTHDADSAESDKRSQKPCRYLLRGRCRSGDKCKYSHEKAMELRKKREKKQKNGVEGSPKDSTQRAASPVAVEEIHASTESAATAPITQLTAVEENGTKKKKKRNKKEKKQSVCKFFLNGSCRDGDRCKYSHEAKTSIQLEKATKPTGITIAVIGQAPPSPDTQLSGAPQQEKIAPSATRNPEEWTTEQQRALDNALKKFPASMDKKERWTSIAKEVDGMTLSDCIDRYKLVCKLIKDGEPIPFALSALTITSPPEHKVQPLCSPVKLKEKPADPSEEERKTSAKIIPENRRVSIQTDPNTSGTALRLEELFLYQIGTLVPHCIVCQVQCMNCPLKFDAKLTLDQDEASLQKWCPRCSVKHVVALRPVFTHAQSDVLAYIDTENCGVVDVLPSDVLASCLECGREALLEKIVAGRRFEQACFSCHTKLAVMTKRIQLGQSSPGEGVPAAGSSASKGQPGKNKRVVQTFVLGQPLPRNGACDHYKHSMRWFRFQCCGKAFPCDVCHDASDCAEANTGKIASKIICGFCSKEQSSSVKECSCGNEMGRHASRSRHWEGGHGCRDPTRMSANDKQKFRGLNKTESQKHKRVGVEGKLRANGVQG